MTRGAASYTLSPNLSLSLPFHPGYRRVSAISSHGRKNGYINAKQLFWASPLVCEANQVPVGIGDYLIFLDQGSDRRIFYGEIRNMKCCVLPAERSLTILWTSLPTRTPYHPRAVSYLLAVSSLYALNRAGHWLRPSSLITLCSSSSIRTCIVL